MKNLLAFALTAIVFCSCQKEHPNTTSSAISTTVKTGETYTYSFAVSQETRALKISIAPVHAATATVTLNSATHTALFTYAAGSSTGSDVVTISGDAPVASQHQCQGHHDPSLPTFNISVADKSAVN